VRGRVLDRDETRGGDYHNSYHLAPTSSAHPRPRHHSRHEDPSAAFGWTSSSDDDDDDGGCDSGFGWPSGRAESSGGFGGGGAGRRAAGGWGEGLGVGASRGTGGGRLEDVKFSECGDDGDIERLLEGRGPPSARYFRDASRRGVKVGAVEEQHSAHLRRKAELHQELQSWAEDVLATGRCVRVVLCCVHCVVLCALCCVALCCVHCWSNFVATCSVLTGRTWFRASSLFCTLQHHN